jgi:hypothetical protein
MTTSDGEELAKKRELLAHARRIAQAKLLPLAGGGILVRQLFQQQRWVVIAYFALAVGLAIRWFVGTGD